MIFYHPKNGRTVEKFYQINSKKLTQNKYKILCQHGIHYKINKFNSIYDMIIKHIVLADPLESSLSTAYKPTWLYSVCEQYL